MTIKIALSGAHNTGKTTSSKLLIEQIKKTYPNLKVCFVSGVARRSPYPVNEATTPEAQKWIWKHQLGAEFTANFLVNPKPDIIICDRSALDNLVYAKHSAKKTKDLHKWGWINKYFNYFKKVHLNSYARIWFKDNDLPLKNDGFRSVDCDFKQKISADFQKIIPYFFYRGSPVRHWTNQAHAFQDIQKILNLIN